MPSWSGLVLNTLQGAVDTTQTGTLLKTTNPRTKPHHASGYIKNPLKRDLFLQLGREEMTFWPLALQYQKQQNFQRYLIIWRHDRPAWVSAWRPYAWFLVGRHLVEAGVLAVLQPRARARCSPARARRRPVGLAAALLLRLRLRRRGRRRLLGCRLLLMLVLLLLILREEATQHGHLLWATSGSSAELPTPRVRWGNTAKLSTEGSSPPAHLVGCPTCGRFAFLMQRPGLKL